MRAKHSGMKNGVAATVLILRWACLHEGMVHLGLLCAEIDWNRQSAKRYADTLVEIGVLRSAGRGCYWLSDKAALVLKSYNWAKWPIISHAPIEKKGPTRPARDTLVPTGS
jgi:DNA-binding IclR family transcriptional regulator